MSHKRDFWPTEREGYVDNLRPAYASVRVPPSSRRNTIIRIEERIGSLTAGAGLCWAAWAVTHNFEAVTQAKVGVWPLGPLELCATGILIWIHAKWRRARS